MSALPARSAILPASGLASSITSMRKIGLLVEAVRADHREFPGECSGFLHGNADASPRRSTRRWRDGEDDCGQQCANEELHDRREPFPQNVFFSA